MRHLSVPPKRLPAVAALLLLGAVSACSLAPKYLRPQTEASPAAYKETEGWRPAQSAQAVPSGNWWMAFADPKLNELEAAAGSANQSLRAAVARFDEARAGAAAAHAGFFPTITGAASANRQKTSTTLANSAPNDVYNTYDVAADFTYEVDLWGRVRNTAAAAKQREVASAADLAAVDLSLRAELAVDYFSLRGFDAQQVMLDKTVVAYEKALVLTRNLHQGGAAAEADVDQAQTQLENARTQAADLKLKRAQAEHAIAVLAGRLPSSFSLPRASHEIGKSKVPAIDPGLPSTLLERRPDIAAAERRAAAANADIGVARAAWFPDISLAAALGYQSGTTPNWISSPSSIWLIGPAAVLTLFDGGRIKALTDQARAAYDEAAANYRQTVLSAFQDVEDNIVAQRQLEKEEKSQEAATAAAERALKQARNRYSGGIATYLEVVVSQNAALQAELALINLQTQRRIASVQLVRALGGGWQADMPSAKTAGKRTLPAK